MEDQSYKEYLHEILVDTYNYFNGELSQFGKIYIAGGSVIDTLIGREPKDYDVFILNEKDSVEDINGYIKEYVNNKNNIFEATKLKKKRFGESIDEAAANFRYNGVEIQLIVKGLKTVSELLDGFDYNLCKFAYGKVELKEKGDFINHLFKFNYKGDDKINYINKSGAMPEDIEKKIIELKINKINEEQPFHTLARGFYLKEKFGAHLQESELMMVIDKINKKKFGNNYLSKLGFTILTINNKDIDDWGS